MKPTSTPRWLFMAILICSFAGYAQQVPLRSDAGLSAKLSAIVTSDSKPGWHHFTDGITVDPANPANFFEQHREAFGLQDGYGMTLLNHTEEKNLNMHHYRFQQTFKGIPIAGAVYILHQRSGKPLKGNGNIVSGFSIDNKPAISGEAAVQSVLKRVNARRYAWEDAGYEKMIKDKKGAVATAYPQPELVFYSGTQNSDVLSYQLAYEMNVLAVDPAIQQKYYVSAATGEVLRAIPLTHETNTPATGSTIYNGTQSFISDFTGSNYVLKEANRNGSGTSIFTYDMNNGTNFSTAVDYQNTSTDWQSEQVGVQGHWSFEKAFDYYQIIHGRNSYDNAGGTITSYLEYGVNYNNASWSQVLHVMNFGGGDGITRRSWASLDVVAHELTHGVTQFSAGLVYQNESGALNESFSDIFGTAVEFYAEGSTADWLVSEDVTINGAGIRSMANPNIHGDPDTYRGTFWVFTDADNGGVHTNSGVQNHWFYLLTNGGSGTNDNGNSFAVTGIGIDMAAAIAYRNLTQYLTPESRYNDAREGALEAAEDLYGRTSAAYAQTAMAWYAVGVGYPVYAAEDLALSAINITGNACDAITLKLVNLSTTGTIPAGATVQILVTENGVPRPAEQVVLPIALAPGNSITIPLSQGVSSTASKINIRAQVSYAPDPEPGNNVITTNIFRGVMTIGGASPDFATIDAAVQALSNLDNRICGHLVFKIRSGQYTGEVRIFNVVTSSAEHTVTFESESGNPDDVILFSAINFNSAYGGVTIGNSDYIRLRNLTITRQLLSPAILNVGLALRGAVQNIVVEGVKFKNPGTSSTTFTCGVEFWPFGEIQKDITLRNNTFEQANNGISNGSNETALVENVLIENNQFINLYSAIKSLTGSISLTIRGNKISSANTATFVLSASASQLLIEGNDIRINSTSSTAFTGIYVFDKPSSTVRVVNNMISLKSAGTSTGIYTSAAAQIDVLHNTIRMEKTTPGNGSGICLFLTSNTSQKKVLNNILFNSMGGASGISLSASTGNEINHNDFYIPNGNIGRLNNVSYQTLAQWQAASGYDLNSVMLQPTFVGSEDLHLSALQLGLKNGKPVSVPFDIDGEQRGSSRYMGADEYYFSSDVGVSAIGPIVLCENGSVQITVKNFSAVDVFSPGIRIPVSLSVNNGMPVRDTLTLQQNLLPGQTTTFAFNQLPGLVENRPVKAQTHYPGDDVPSNDTLTVTATLNNVYTVGGLNPNFTTLQAAINFVSANVVPVLCDHIILRIRTGVYPQAITVNEIPGVHLVFESETGNKDDVIITSSIASTVTLPGAKHITFRNLTLRYLGSTATEGAVLIKNICEDISITNCHVLTAALATEHYGIKSGPSQAPRLNGLNLTHNVFTNGGIKMESNANVSYPFDNIHIDSNTFVNSHTHAIYLYRTGLVTVKDNAISSTHVSSGISITQPLKTVYVERNRISLSAGVNGIYFYNLIPSFANIHVINNFVNVQSGASVVNGITIYGKGGYVYHNTVKLSAGTVQPTQAFVFSTQSSGVAFRHNILSSTLTNAVGVNRISGSLSADYNDIYVPNGYTGSYNQQLYTTLADWRTASGLDLQSKNVEPIFVSTSDLHLATYQPELLGSSASVFPSVQIDIDGDPRTIPLHIGADEYIRPPFVELSQYTINVPLFGQHYHIHVNSNSTWEFVAPLPNGITIEQVTSGGFEINVPANPVATPRDWSLVVRTTSTPVATATLQLHQEGSPVLSATTGTASVTLSWTPVMASVSQYKIYFSDTGTPPTTLLTTVSGTETTFTHSALPFGTYIYQVSAIDINANESARSSAVTVMLSAPFVTVSPDAAVAPLLGQKRTIHVSSNSEWIIKEPLPAGITVGQITTESFLVQVAANPLSTPREFSIVVETVKTPAAAATLHLQQDGTPHLTAEGLNQKVVLSWPAVKGAAQYKLYRLVKGSPKLLVTLPETETTFTNTGLTNGVKYSYQLSVVAGSYESALSNVATAIPQQEWFFNKQGEALSVHPNPVEDKLALHGSVDRSGSYQAIITSIYGIPAGKQELYLKQGECIPEIEVKTLSPGMYIITLMDPSTNVVTMIRFEKK
jgi:Zn-dependent metalloprotease